MKEDEIDDELEEDGFDFHPCAKNDS